MTNGMRKAISGAIDSGTDRIGLHVREATFWALRQAGYVDDSGWLTEAGKAALDN